MTLSKHHNPEFRCCKTTSQSTFLLAFYERHFGTVRIYGIKFGTYFIPIYPCKPKYHKFISKIHHERLDKCQEQVNKEVSGTLPILLACDTHPFLFVWLTYFLFCHAVSVTSLTKRLYLWHESYHNCQMLMLPYCHSGTNVWEINCNGVAVELCWVLGKTMQNYNKEMHR